jgi:hypothetical protein
MSKREVFSRPAEPTDLFSALTAEAWMDPSLAAELARDKAATVARFAKVHGYKAPADDAVEAFELPENPIGELKLVTPDVTMATTDNMTPCGPCPTEVTCYCSADCFTVQCTHQYPCEGA